MVKKEIMRTYLPSVFFLVLWKEILANGIHLQDFYSLCSIISSFSLQCHSDHEMDLGLECHELRFEKMRS